MAAQRAASMRPPEFTGGNTVVSTVDNTHLRPASMRPPEFTGGNGVDFCGAHDFDVRCFNEAAGIHRRKQGRSLANGDIE